MDNGQERGNEWGGVMKLGLSLSFLAIWASIWGAKLGNFDAVFLPSTLAFIIVGGLLIVRDEEE